MNNKVDFIVLILRFVFGAILGAIATLIPLTPLFFASILTGKMVLTIAAAVAVLMGVFAAIFGDRLIVGLMKILGFFKFMMCF
jgi:hypothetical protein